MRTVHWAAVVVLQLVWAAWLGGMLGDRSTWSLTDAARRPHDRP